MKRDKQRTQSHDLIKKKERFAIEISPIRCFPFALCPYSVPLWTDLAIYVAELGNNEPEVGKI